MIMKEQTAKLKYLHVAPRKTRLVADALKGLSVNEAEARLLMEPKRASAALLKLLRSAVADAKNNAKLNPEILFVKEIRVDSGPMIKRYMPRAMGRANPIQKKTSHITIVLAESEKAKSPRFKIIKPEKISKKEKIKRMAKAGEEEAKKPKESKEREEKQKPAGGKQGFIKRMFRRKAV